MSELRIRQAEWPSTILSCHHVGDEVSFLVTGRIFSIEEDLIDTTTVGGPVSVVPGDRTTRVLILDIERAGRAA